MKTTFSLVTLLAAAAALVEGATYNVGKASWQPNASGAPSVVGVPITGTGCPTELRNAPMSFSGNQIYSISVRMNGAQCVADISTLPGVSGVRTGTSTASPLATFLARVFSDLSTASSRTLTAGAHSFIFAPRPLVADSTLSGTSYSVSQYNPDRVAVSIRNTFSESFADSGFTRRGGSSRLAQCDIPAYTGGTLVARHCDQSTSSGYQPASLNLDDVGDALDIRNQGYAFVRATCTVYWGSFQVDFIGNAALRSRVSLFSGDPWNPRTRSCSPGTGNADCPL